jgi:hypothetical protein
VCLLSAKHDNVCGATNAAARQQLQMTSMAQLILASDGAVSVTDRRGGDGANRNFLCSPAAAAEVGGLRPEAAVMSWPAAKGCMAGLASRVQKRHARRLIPFKGPLSTESHRSAH